MLQKFREGGGKIKYSLPQNVTYIFIRQFVIDNVKESLVKFHFPNGRKYTEEDLLKLRKNISKNFEARFHQKREGGKNCIFVK